MNWGRRDPRRALEAAIHYPFRLVEGKDGKLSTFRVIVLGSAIQMWRHWPAEWSYPARDVLALILFAMPLGDLFVMIPVSEALAAMQAFFFAVMGRAGLVPGTTVESSSSSVKTTVPPVVIAPAVDQPAGAPADPPLPTDVVEPPPEK